MTSVIRSAVSKKKVRFQQDGFDLDLTYITPKIIAMGYPSDGVEGKYRNPMSEVQRMFQKYHSDHYFIYNLCSERTYDPSKFGGRCHRLGFPDHNPPPLGTIEDFCIHVDAFLKESDENVVAVHCKAGKGRTGTMIAAYLMYAGISANAKDAMKLYGDIRTRNGQGVTIPSQRRYVRYYEDIVLKRKSLPDPHNPKLVLLKRVRMYTIPNFDMGGGCDPYYRVFCNRRCQIKSKPIKHSDLKTQHKANDGYVDFDVNLVIWGDCKFDMIDYDRVSKDDKMLQIWFNTDHLEKEEWEVLPNEIDGPHKDKHYKHFNKGFWLVFFFDLNPEGVSLDPVEIVSKIEEEEETESVHDSEELFGEDEDNETD